MARFRLYALAHNLGNFGCPGQNQFMDWSPISLEENPIKVGRALRPTAIFQEILPLIRNCGRSRKPNIHVNLEFIWGNLADILGVESRAYRL